MEPWPGWLHLDGWEGRTKQEVLVIDETPKKFRITPAGTEKVKLGGRYRWLAPGASALVPQYAVTKRAKVQAPSTVVQDMQLKVLLVEDLPELRRATGRSLRFAGFAVTDAADVREALSILETQTFDAIVSDLEMPGQSGADFYEILVSQNHSLARRFILFTGAPEKVKGRVPNVLMKGSKMQSLSDMIRALCEEKENA